MSERTQEMSKRVIRDEPGITEIQVESREVLRDGPMRVACWWSEEDAAYIAHLTDDEPEGRPFTATHTGIGATREEALAHLAVSEYVTALAVAEAPATPPDAETGQPTMAAMRALRDDAEFRAMIVERIAEQDAKNIGCPTLEDADNADMHRLAAEEFVSLILEAFVSYRVPALATEQGKGGDDEG